MHPAHHQDQVRTRWITEHVIPSLWLDNKSSTIKLSHVRMLGLTLS
ncbi:MAG TPA: hypothetical protein VK137_00525 [Planctomycetaceae bacterium]|nr:hypothetical protein [Planctomycetaceae bacterium]